MENTSNSRRRRQYVWGGCLAVVTGLMSYAYYAQYRLYLDPCPLCITQRVFYIGIGLAALVGLSSVGRVTLQRIAASLLALSAIGGALTATRQVWLQHLPPQEVPACGPGLQYWLENEPMLRTLSLLFKGDGNCAEVQWTFLGFSMGEWSLAWFVLFLVAGVVLFLRADDARAVAVVTPGVEAGTA